MTPLNYRGPGEHSVRELENMLNEAQERISHFNSTPTSEIDAAANRITEESLQGTEEAKNFLRPLLRNAFKLGAYFVMNKQY